MHSKKSDGTDRPSQMARLALAAGLSAVALTDHDTTEGNRAFAKALAELAEERDTEIEFIPGCEISCRHEGTGNSTHILCYFVEEGKTPLQKMLRGLRRDRDSRNEKLVDRIHELGYTKVKAHRIVEIAGKPLAEAGRPHFAQAFIDAYPIDGKPAQVALEGLPTNFDTIQSVFDGVLDASAPGYIPKAHITPAEATEAALASGAVTVLAHPILTFCKTPKRGAPLTIQGKHAILDPIFAEMAGIGVAGAEAHYSRNSPEETEMLLDLCAVHGLVATGGSDYHGANKKDLEIGIGRRSSRGTQDELRVPDKALEGLKAALVAGRVAR
jgi:predicted metal-dependent phosphoesterase TrpH